MLLLYGFMLIVIAAALPQARTRFQAWVVSSTVMLAMVLIAEQWFIWINWVDWSFRAAVPVAYGMILVRILNSPEDEPPDRGHKEEAPGLVPRASIFYIAVTISFSLTAICCRQSA